MTFANALRTPDARFVGLPGFPFEPHYVDTLAGHECARAHPTCSGWFGQSFMAIGTRLLMLVADLHATAISLTVGYESPSQLSRAYRRHFGVAPAADAARLRRNAGGRAA